MSQNHQSKLIKLLWMFFSLISDQIHSWSAWVYCCHGDVPCNKGCVMFCGHTELSTGPSRLTDEIGVSLVQSTTTFERSFSTKVAAETGEECIGQQKMPTIFDVLMGHNRGPQMQILVWINCFLFIMSIYKNTVYIYIIKHVCISHTHKSIYNTFNVYIYMLRIYTYIYASHIYIYFIYIYIHTHNVFTTTKPVVFPAPWIFYGFHVHGPDVHISPWGRLAQEEERNQFRADHLPGPARISQGCEEKNHYQYWASSYAFPMV